MGLWENQLLPRLIDWGMDNPVLKKERATALASASGRVLEVGFGSGLNLEHYPVGKVTALVAVEPNARAVQIAAPRIESVDFPVEVIVLEGECIPCPDESFDTVVSTFTLCTIPGVSDALAQLRRVLKPGGTFLFLEHGRASEAHVHRWQDRVNPLQKTLFGGCHLNREIDVLVDEAGFEVTDLERYYARGPKVMSYFYRGQAKPKG